MIKVLPPALEGYKLAYITEDEVPQVGMLLERCADYLDLVAGLPPSPALAHNLFTAVPPEKGYEDKILLGVWAEPAKLVGLLDVVRDYPTQGVWFLGLLLLEPAQRRQGDGTQIYRAFEQWAKTLGAKEIRLSVAQQNEVALRFWRRLGFTELEHKPPERFGAKESVFILMNRVLFAD
jgi:GNAT superfamily N-acetyltransferase